MSGRRLPDDAVDRFLREALADDLPKDVEERLRRDVRQAWRRASEPRPARWLVWSGTAGSRPLLPQPALVAAALAMLGAGAVMQAAPPPPAVVESFEGRQAAVAVARALERATAMQCTVEAAHDGGRRLSYRIDWRAPGETHVRLGGAAGSGEQVLRLPGAGPSVLTRTSTASAEAPLGPTLEPARDFLSPAALGGRLAAAWRPATGFESATRGAEVFFVGPRQGRPGLTVVIDAATHLPLRLDGTDRDGRTQAAVCRWP